MNRNHRSRYLSLQDTMSCPVCKRETAYHITNNVRGHWCIECNLCFDVRYNKSKHTWYRINLRKGEDL